MNFWDQAIAEWAYNYGMDHPEQEWLLSDYDTYHRNPHYAGPKGRHPCDGEYDDDEVHGYRATTGEVYGPFLPRRDDDIPF